MARASSAAGANGVGAGTSGQRSHRGVLGRQAEALRLNQPERSRWALPADHGRQLPPGRHRGRHSQQRPISGSPSGNQPPYLSPIRRGGPASRPVAVLRAGPAVRTRPRSRQARGAALPGRAPGATGCSQVRRTQRQRPSPTACGDPSSPARRTHRPPGKAERGTARLRRGPPPGRRTHQCQDRTRPAHRDPVRCPSAPGPAARVSRAER